MGGERPLARATLISRKLSLEIRVGMITDLTGGCPNSEVGYAGEDSDSPK